MKKIVVCGSTGSIGRQTLDVCRWFPGELQVMALTGGSNIELLAAQVREFHPAYAALADESRYQEFKELLGADCPTEILAGREAVQELAGLAGADMQVAAISGLAGLDSVLRGLEAGLDIAFANKETLVAAGALVMDKVHSSGANFYPVDSEHSAIWQCLDGRGDPASLVLTCSGGPFKDAAADVIAAATPEQTLRHPTWDMGAKITVDSATLMNKGLEVIEAHWLFDMPYERIEVVVHPESIIHSMVQYADGSLLAQMSYPDMCLPIQNALFYPERRANELRPLNFAELGKLTFRAPDTGRFPCLRLAIEAGKAGGTAPAVLSGANEVMNAAFLRGRIPLGGIYDGVAAVLDKHENGSAAELVDIVAADAWARQTAADWLAAQGV